MSCSFAHCDSVNMGFICLSEDSTTRCHLLSRSFRGIDGLKHTSPALEASCSSIGFILLCCSALRSNASVKFCIFISKYCPGAFDRSSTGFAGSASFRMMGTVVVPVSLLGKVKVVSLTATKRSAPAEYSTRLAPLGGEYKQT